MVKRDFRTGINPLPSFVRASAQDAGNTHMRKAGRVKWDDDDWNVMCETQEQLIRSLYGRDMDHNNPDACYLRFQIAEQLEKRGEFGLRSDATVIMSRIDQLLAA